MGVGLADHSIGWVEMALGRGSAKGTGAGPIAGLTRDSVTCADPTE